MLDFYMKVNQKEIKIQKLHLPLVRKKQIFFSTLKVEQTLQKKTRKKLFQKIKKVLNFKMLN